jgi:cytidine deaminase
MTGPIDPTKGDPFVELFTSAWSARESARILGTTAVGAAALDGTGRVWSGCNVEHQFRSHDIHAEVNAIGSMIAGGNRELVAIAVVAERERFTPCGACLDWIWEFGGAACSVGTQSSPTSQPVILTAGELMPYYPH